MTTPSARSSALLPAGPYTVIGASRPLRREGLQHSRQTEHMVGMEVREEHLFQVDQTRVGAEQLALRALAAIDEQPIATAPHEGGGGAPRRCGRRARRPEEHEVEIHGRGSYPGPRRCLEPESRGRAACTTASSSSTRRQPPPRAPPVP